MPNFPPFRLSPPAHHFAETTVGLTHYDNFMLLDTCAKHPAINRPQDFFNYSLQIATSAVEFSAKGKAWVLDYGNRTEDLGIPQAVAPMLSQPEVHIKFGNALYYLRVPIPLIRHYHPLNPAQTAINALRWFLPPAGAILRGITCREVNRNPGRSTA